MKAKCPFLYKIVKPTKKGYCSQCKKTLKSNCYIVHMRYKLFRPFCKDCLEQLEYDKIKKYEQ